MEEIDATDERFILSFLMKLSQLAEDPSLWNAQMIQDCCLLCDWCEEPRVVALLMKFHFTTIAVRVLELPPLPRLAELLMVLSNNICCYDSVQRCMSYDDTLMWSFMHLFIRAQERRELVEVLRFFMTATTEREGCSRFDERDVEKLIGKDNFYAPVARDPAITPSFYMKSLMLPFFKKDAEGLVKTIFIMMSSTDEELLTKCTENLFWLCMQNGSLNSPYLETVICPELVRGLMSVIAQIWATQNLVETPLVYKIFVLVHKFSKIPSGLEALKANHRAVMIQSANVLRSSYVKSLPMIASVLTCLMSLTNYLNPSVLKAMFFVHHNIQIKCMAMKRGSRELPWDTAAELVEGELVSLAQGKQLQMKIRNFLKLVLQMNVVNKGALITADWPLKIDMLLAKKLLC